MKQIRKIVHKHQNKIDTIIEKLAKKIKEDPNDYNGFVADVAYGRAREDGTFTVPLWALRKKKEGYFTYYVAHEMAHVRS